jgi:hypothetical protein
MIVVTFQGGQDKRSAGIFSAAPNNCINRSAASEFRMVPASTLRRARLCRALGVALKG